MNKAKINELARKSDGKQPVGDGKQPVGTGTDEGNRGKASAKAQNSAAGSVPATLANKIPPSPAASADRLQAMIYAALVGGSDFLRTQASEADVCRNAYRRSMIAVRIWREQKAKEMS